MEQTDALSLPLEVKEDNENEAVSFPLEAKEDQDVVSNPFEHEQVSD
jgi:hypothetical protein